jgi:hypothetical protein
METHSLGRPHTHTRSNPKVDVTALLAHSQKHKPTKDPKQPKNNPKIKVRGFASEGCVFWLVKKLPIRTKGCMLAGLAELCGSLGNQRRFETKDHLQQKN